MGSQSSKVSEDEKPPAATEEAAVEKKDEEDEEDEVDEWDKRIFSTGCADENDRMRDCHFKKKNWSECFEEIEQFKKCWKAHGNEERTSQKDI